MAKRVDKKQTLLAFLERGVAMLHLDARRAGVSVPQRYAGQAQLLLKFSYRYGLSDLLIDEWGVRATLSFSNRPFLCALPWSAVFAITSETSGAGQLWPEDVPAEVAELLRTPEPVQLTSVKLTSVKRKHPKPGTAKPVAAKLEPEKPEAAPPEKPPRAITRGHLRLVK